MNFIDYKLAKYDSSGICPLDSKKKPDFQIRKVNDGYYLEAFNEYKLCFINLKGEIFLDSILWNVSRNFEKQVTFFTKFAQGGLLKRIITGEVKLIDLNK